MLKKNYSKSGQVCRATFKLPAEVNATEAVIVGEFNDWDPEANPMNRLKDGGFSVTLSLDAEKAYRFRYLLDGQRWENDWEADAYVGNQFGTEDSLITL